MNPDVLARVEALEQVVATLDSGKKDLFPLREAMHMGAVELVELYRSLYEEKWEELLDGASTREPNIDERLRVVRFSFSLASLFVGRFQKSGVLPAGSGTERRHCIGHIYFECEKLPLEVNNLIGDVVQSAIEIVHELTNEDSPDWGNIKGCADHISDHIEYCEDMVIDILRPSGEDPSQHYRRSHH